MAKWDVVFSNVSDKLPKFNDKLLLDFRNDSVDQAINYLEYLFQESLKTFEGRVTFKQHYILSPEEQVKHEFKTKPPWKIEVKPSEWRLVRFDFEFNSEIYSSYLYVPHLVNGKHFVLNGLELYPIFGLIEKGIHRAPKGIVIKVLRAWISANRSAHIKLVDMFEKHVSLENSVVCKVHHRKKMDPPPIFLFHLIRQGFYGAFQRVGFETGQIDVVDVAVENDDEFLYFLLRKDVYLKVHKSFKTNLRLKRSVVAFIEITKRGKKRFLIEDLLHPHGDYYKVCMGRYIFKVGSEPLLCSNIIDHMSSLEQFIDPKAIMQLSKVDIYAKDIYELFEIIELKIDEWLVHYKPTDMFQKRLGAMDELQTSFIQEIFNSAYDIGNKKNRVLTPDVVKAFTKKIPSGSIVHHMRGNKMLQMPQKYNSNWLITIGAKQIRSIDNIEKRSAPNKSRRISDYLVLADESVPVVETMLTYPTSAPCTSGNINPFIEVDSTGGIIEPDYAKVDK